MTQLLDDETGAKTQSSRGRAFVQVRRAGLGALASCVLAVGAAGCSAGVPENLEAEDHKVIALMEELQPAAAVQLETLGKESLGSFSSGASIYKPADGEDTTVGSLSGYAQGQGFSVWGMCTGVEGTLPVKIEGFGTYELDCAPADEEMTLQVVAEGLVVMRDTIEFTVAGAPRGSAWHLEAVGQG